LTPRSTSAKGRPEPVFFVDENLGHQFISSLRIGGLQVKAAAEVCRGAKDVDWLLEIARNGWIAITQDQLNQDLEEQIAIALYGAKVFVLVGNASHRDLADLFLQRIKWVRKQIAERDEAFMGKIYVKGGRTTVITLTELCSRSSRRWGRR
jgi:PIN like domain